MTDKEQIIIDGVNVKDCRRRIGKDNYCRYFKRLCSDNNFNCVWKQLARKTQECEELKEKCEELKEDRYNLNMEMYVFDRYRKALEEIEEIVSKDYYDDTWADISIKLDEILDIINKAKGERND